LANDRSGDKNTPDVATEKDSETELKMRLHFAPEFWPSVQKFRMFIGPPFPDSGSEGRELRKGAATAANHLEKFDILVELANQLQPSLVEDEAELKKSGYTPALRHREFAALTETLYCELYSSLDGVRRTLYGAYKKVRGIQNKSTNTLFSRANGNEYGDDLPKEIRDALALAFTSWFSRLREIRTEVTHGEVGSCHLNVTTRKIGYFHTGLGPDQQSRVFVIEDVIGDINTIRQGVFDTVEIIFGFMYLQLEPIERPVMCGVYKSKFYQRTVAPEKNLTIDSGKCNSRIWFENEPDYQCPLKETCGAYRNALNAIT
jgi:hypothetical protein